MPDPVRVRDNETGAEYSTYAVSEKGEVYEGLTLLKGEAAVDATGTLLPPKYPEPEPEKDFEPDPVADAADVPPTTDTTVVVPPDSTTEPTEPPVTSEAAPPATAKQSSKSPRPTEPTTGPKAATPKES
jgi:hypothetical protein